MKILGRVLWVAALATIARSDSKSTTVGVCRTAACINAASELSEIVNLNADPCIDFYEFACGGFDQSHKSSEYMDYRMVSTNKAWNDIDQLLISTVDPIEPRPFKLAKTFYRSCVDEPMIEAKGLEPLRRLVRELGGWPVVDGIFWNSDNFDWRYPFYLLRSDEVDDYWRFEDRLGYLIHFRIPNYESPNPIESNQSVHGAPWTDDPIDFDKTGSRPYTYYESLINIAVMLGANLQRARIELRPLMLFEKRLAAFKRDPAKYTILPFRELKTKYQNIPWMTYIRNFVPSSKAIDDDALVVIHDPDYYVQLEALMAKTPKKIQADYIMAKIVLRYGIYSTQNMRRAVETALGPYFNGRNRRTYCRDETMKYMWRAVTALYANKYFSDEIRNDVFNIFTSIVAAMGHQVKKNEQGYWTKIDDRKKVGKRINKTSIVIGYPAELLNITILDELYENLTFTKDDYLGNMQALSRYDRELSIKEITRPYAEWTLREFEEWKGSASGVAKAVYAPNQIMIGTQYIRDLYYGIGRPKHMNYGGLGNIIAHEIAHIIFESSYSSNNLYVGLRWWKEFEDNAQCLIDQYNNFRVDNMGHKLQGAKTIKENVADIGGVRLAYEAYKRSIMGKPGEPKLPGFEKYSDKQMFWLNLGSTMCEKILPQQMASMIAYFNEYTIAKFRIIGMVANMPEFAQDFNCNAPSIVNPVKRCEIF